MNTASALTAEEIARLKELSGLSLESLLEVEIKLDDVFDVFDGLVQQQKVKVATGHEQNAAVAPSVTSVITAQDIEAAGARTLDEALRMVPGLHISRFTNWNPTYTMRGIFNTLNSEVLFLLNGMPIKNITMGNRGTFDIVPNIQSVARIEVIRGPGSAMYGADAFSGVINVITKTVKDIDGTEFGVRAGSFDTYDGWIMHGKRYGEVELATSVQLSKTNGFDGTVHSDVQSFIDGELSQILPHYQPLSKTPGKLNLGEKKIDTHFNVGWRQWLLNLDYTGVQDRGLGMYTLNLDNEGQGDAYRSSLDLIWHDPNLTENWEGKVRFSYQHWSDGTRYHQNSPLELLFNPDVGLGWTKAHTQNSEDYFYLNNEFVYRGWAQHVLHFGTGLSTIDYKLQYFRKNWDVDAAGNVILAEGDSLFNKSELIKQSHTERDSWHAFIQDSWTFAPNWELTAGVRYDDYSDFGNTTNPRAALVWQVTPKFTAKLLYGRAFRAPTFTDMYTSNTFISGNPDLKPETLSSYELAFDWRAMPSLYLTLSLYKFDIRSKISNSSVNKETLDLKFQNRGERDGMGAEFEARWKATKRASVLFNYAYADNTATEDGFEWREINSPRHTSYLRLDWMFQPNWFLDTQAYWSADYARFPEDTRDKPDDNFSLDLTLRYKKMRNWDWNVALGVRNILDTDLSEPAEPEFFLDDYILPGRTWFVEARYRFRK